MSLHAIDLKTPLSFTSMGGASKKPKIVGCYYVASAAIPFYREGFFQCFSLTKFPTAQIAVARLIGMLSIWKDRRFVACKQAQNYVKDRWLLLCSIQRNSALKQGVFTVLEAE